MQICTLEICYYHFHNEALKLQIDIFSATLVGLYLCNIVGIIITANCYFQKPAVPKMLIVNLRTVFFYLDTM